MKTTPTRRHRLARGAAAVLLGALVASTVCAADGEAAVPAVAGKIERLRERLAHPAPNDTLVIAHRSCWHEAPENSIAAMQACIRMGVDGVEFDVRHSKDGVAVVIHDETLERTTNGRGPVTELTLAELKALRLREGDGGPGAALTAEAIPTLAEFLAVAKGELLLVFDVKDLTQEESFRIAKEVGVQRQAIFFYECANTLLLDRIRSFRNEAIVFPITFGDGPPLARALAICASNPGGLVHAKFTDPAYLDDASAQQAVPGRRLWVATMWPADVGGHGDAAAMADPDAHWGWLLRHGANMIMGNEPQALLRYLKAHGQR